MIALKRLPARRATGFQRELPLAPDVYTSMACLYFFIELQLLSGCHVFVRPLQDICQESNALSGICGDIVMRLSGLAKFKSQSKCSMRGSGKVGKIPAISCDVLSEEGAQVNGLAGPFIS